jgi:hypothetical protein
LPPFTVEPVASFVWLPGSQISARIESTEAMLMRHSSATSVCACANVIV